jgi:hypothetical protein
MSIRRLQKLLAVKYDTINMKVYAYTDSGIMIEYFLLETLGASLLRFPGMVWRNTFRC